MSKSSLALSNLRAVVILLVVAFHSVLAYLGSQPASPAPFDSPPYHWRAIPILDSERWFGFDLFCASQYVYLMHLMFFLSGMFVWSSLRRRGAKAFLSNRFLRLGVPFVIGVFLLMPVAHYPVYRMTAVDPSWSAFWAHWKALPFWATGQLWFLWHLLLLNIIAAALFRFAPGFGELLGRLSNRAGDQPGRYFVALVAISAGRLYAAGFPFQALAMDSIRTFRAAAGLHATLHGLFFCRPGNWSIWNRAGIARIGRNAHAALADLGCGRFWCIPALDRSHHFDNAGMGHGTAGAGNLGRFRLVLSCGAISFALAVVFIRFAMRRVQAFDSLAENAYGIYLVHYVFVIWLQYMMLSFALPAIIKGASVFAGALALSWISTAAMCRLRMAARVLGREHVLVRAR